MAKSTAKKQKKNKDENGSTRIKIGDNNRNTAVIVGDNNQLIQKNIEPKPLQVPPNDENEGLLISFGRWLMRSFFHGDMKHSLTPFTIVLGIIAAITGSLSFGPLILDPTYFVKNAYLELGLTLGFALSAFGGIGVVETSKRTICPKCGQKFMYTRKERLKTGEGTHQGMEVTNYRSTYSCDNCHYTRKNVREYGQRQIPESDVQEDEE